LFIVQAADRSPDGDILVWDDYYTIQCAGCKTVSFCIKSTSTEDQAYDERTGDYQPVETTRLYPSRIAGRLELENSHLLPHAVYKVYEETRAALANDQPVLAGIGIRAIVETVCKDQSATGNRLVEHIDDLARKGVITPDGARILHSLRFMGNEAAHEVKAHSEDELITALDVVEYVLKGVYILPRLASRLPQQRPHGA
jgi:hypothetical protein